MAKVNTLREPHKGVILQSTTGEEFTRKSSKSELIPTYNAARDETMSVTEEIVKVENEIDARVKSLYGVD
jgi:hypothetical protein